MFPGDSEQLEAALKRMVFPGWTGRFRQVDKIFSKWFVVRKGESKIAALSLVWLGVDRSGDLANVLVRACFL